MLLITALFHKNVSSAYEALLTSNQAFVKNEGLNFPGNFEGNSCFEIWLEGEYKSVLKLWKGSEAGIHSCRFSNMLFYSGMTKKDEVKALLDTSGEKMGLASLPYTKLRYSVTVRVLLCYTKHPLRKSFYWCFMGLCKRWWR